MKIKNKIAAPLIAASFALAVTTGSGQAFFRTRIPLHESAISAPAKSADSLRKKLPFNVELDSSLAKKGFKFTVEPADSAGEYKIRLFAPHGVEVSASWRLGSAPKDSSEISSTVILNGEGRTIVIYEGMFVQSPSQALQAEPQNVPPAPLPDVEGSERLNNLLNNPGNR